MPRRSEWKTKARREWETMCVCVFADELQSGFKLNERRKKKQRWKLKIKYTSLLRQSSQFVLKWKESLSAKYKIYTERDRTEGAAQAGTLFTNGRIIEECTQRATAAALPTFSSLWFRSYSNCVGMFVFLAFLSYLNWFFKIYTFLFVVQNGIPLPFYPNNISIVLRALGMDFCRCQACMYMHFGLNGKWFAETPFHSLSIFPFPKNAVHPSKHTQYCLVWKK